MKELGSVELTIVDEKDQVTTETHTNIDEALDAIRWHENSCEIFF